jgi:hypothetical protein
MPKHKLDQPGEQNRQRAAGLFQPDLCLSKIASVSDEKASKKADTDLEAGP